MCKYLLFNLNPVMTTVVKIINFLNLYLSLVHRQLNSLFQKLEYKYKDLLLYRNVHWLSSGQVI